VQTKAFYLKADSPGNVVFWQGKLRASVADKIYDVNLTNFDTTQVASGRNLVINSLGDTYYIRDGGLYRVRAKRQATAPVAPSSTARSFDLTNIRLTAGVGSVTLLALLLILPLTKLFQRRHAYNVARLNKEAAIESKNQWDSIVNPMAGAFQSALAGMLQRTMTWRQALGNIFKSVLDLFTNMISKMLMKWISNELAKTASSQAGTTARMGMDTSAAATSVTTKATEATAVVGANAAEAASGAASSQASIPYVGPILAAAAFASIMAMVLGARSSISSARGGYDIPAGLNPMTQLHEREMVLPAAQADVIRQMAEDRVSGGGGNHYHLHAIDARGVERLLRDNGHVMAKVLSEQARNFKR
jgi:hypothetical protein